MPAAPYMEEYEIQGDSFVDVGEASTKLKSVLKMLGIPSDITRRASIIAYEAEMNVVIHAGGGIIRVYIDSESLRIVAEDKGPGIEDVALAMQEGYSTAPDSIRELGFGAGMGLPNINRNADSLKIDSRPGRGTLLEAVIFFSLGEGG